MQCYFLLFSKAGILINFWVFFFSTDSREAVENWVAPAAHMAYCAKGHQCFIFTVLRALMPANSVFLTQVRAVL